MNHSIHSRLAVLAAAICFVPALAVAFDFDGRDYELRSDKNGIREYLTGGETLDNWTRLISVRRFEGLDDPRAYAQQLLKRAKASGPAANGQILERNGVFVVDFLVFPPEGTEPQFAEWNLWRITKKDGGLEAVQFARRFHDFSEDSVAEIKSSLPRLLGALEKFAP